LLNTDQFEGIINIITVLNTELDNFADPFHQSVERFRLRVATSQRRDRSYVVSLFIALDEDCVFPLGFHWSIPLRGKYSTPKNKNDPSRLLATGRSLIALLTGAIFILAATYVPTQLPVQYHRPSGA
jgi:hypothetical protein